MAKQKMVKGSVSYFDKTPSGFRKTEYRPMTWIEKLVAALVEAALLLGAAALGVVGNELYRSFWQ
jgi:hypothetical protein